MFRIKICGVTNIVDAQAAAEFGADAVGFNFYRPSKRFIEFGEAQRIAGSLPDSILKVGVFVNHRITEVQEAVEQIGLDCVQLHGDEPATFISELSVAVPVVRAFRCGSNGLAPLASYLDDCSAGWIPDAVLLDADAGQNFGGTGRAPDWARIAKERAMLGDIRVILAGGLTPANVASAISAVRPDAVDVAGGVERLPGKKDSDLIKRFVAATRQAFDLI
jgi:phosphoribosylanthranilate isomerase